MPDDTPAATDLAALLHRIEALEVKQAATDRLIISLADKLATAAEHLSRVSERRDE